MLCCCSYSTPSTAFCGFYLFLSPFLSLTHSLSLSHSRFLSLFLFYYDDYDHDYSHFDIYKVICHTYSCPPLDALILFRGIPFISPSIISIPTLNQIATCSKDGTVSWTTLESSGFDCRATLLGGQGVMKSVSWRRPGIELVCGGAWS